MSFCEGTCRPSNPILKEIDASPFFKGEDGGAKQQDGRRIKQMSSRSTGRNTGDSLFVCPSDDACPRCQYVSIPSGTDEEKAENHHAPADQRDSVRKFISTLGCILDLTRFSKHGDNLHVRCRVNRQRQHIPFLEASRFFFVSF